MRERARVSRIEGNNVFLSSLPHEECSHCARCGAHRSRPIVLTSEKSPELKEGDIVTVLMAPSAMLRVSLLLYGLPLVVFLIGALGIYAVTPNAVLAFCGAVIMTGFSYVLAGRKLKTRSEFSPRIVKE